jgi:threonine/homoserine/homoserine lactone efflux protein
MPPSDHLLEFALTAFVLIVVPGPTVLFVVSRGVALGRRAALATVAGNTGGVLVQVVLVALGLGTLVERSEAVFTVIKLVGAAYLVVLGVRMIRRRRPLAGLADATQVPKGPLQFLLLGGMFLAIGVVSDSAGASRQAPPGPGWPAHAAGSRRSPAQAAWC